MDKSKSFPLGVTLTEPSVDSTVWISLLASVSKSAAMWSAISVALVAMSVTFVATSADSSKVDKSVVIVPPASVVSRSVPLSTTVVLSSLVGSLSLLAGIVMDKSKSFPLGVTLTEPSVDSTVWISLLASVSKSAAMWSAISVALVAMSVTFVATSADSSKVDKSVIIVPPASVV